MNARTLRLLGSVLLLVVVLGAGCAAGPNPVQGDDGAAGFWLGLWQGIIAPVAFVVSLFADGVNVYEVHNNGNWYDFGFVLGAGILFGGGGAGSRMRRKRRRRWRSAH